MPPRGESRMILRTSERRSENQEKMFKPIKMNFPIDTVVNWVNGWAKATKDVAKNEAEKAIIADVVTMVAVAKSVMTQVKKEGN